MGCSCLYRCSHQNKLFDNCIVCFSRHTIILLNNNETENMNEKNTKFCYILRWANNVQRNHMEIVPHKLVELHLIFFTFSSSSSTNFFSSKQSNAWLYRIMMKTTQFHRFRGKSHNVEKSAVNYNLWFLLKTGVLNLKLHTRWKILMRNDLQLFSTDVGNIHVWHENKKFAGRNKWNLNMPHI